MKYICSNCGEEHEDFPALAFKSPVYYDILSEQEKSTKGELTSDSIQEGVQRFSMANSGKAYAVSATNSKI